MDYVGERVKKLRQVMGWSQEQMARQIPVGIRTVQRWEKGAGVRGLGTLQKLDLLFEQAGIKGEVDPTVEEGERT